VLAGASGAQAHTTITCEPCSFPYQRWVDEAKVPTPDVTLTVIEGPCAIESVGVCTAPALLTTWVDAAKLTTVELSPHEAFLHELGHVFDAYTLPEWARSRYRHIRNSVQPWFGPTSGEGLAEVFAESYMGCALARAGYLMERPLSLYVPRICHLIIQSATQNPSV
jgi:hypothetical protein